MDAQLDQGPMPAAAKPLYKDSHESCSVMVGRIRNIVQLSKLSAKDQFAWLHRFYHVVDRIASKHQVYKLFGGQHGFLFSTAVAEPDAAHAATLLRFALHLHQATLSIRFPGNVPVDICVALASSSACSGLLGSTSLTYQIVGRCMYEAQALADSQEEVPVLVAHSMTKELGAKVAAHLVQVGRLQLDSTSSLQVDVPCDSPRRRGGPLGAAEKSREGGSFPVYTLERYSHMKLM